MSQQSSESPLHKSDERIICLEDRISRLPDEILIAILSRLTIKEAAATSILARRWICLWTFVFGSLDFDAKKRGRLLQNNPEIYVTEASKYIEWVNHVMRVHQGHQVCHLRFCFPLCLNGSPEIDNWIKCGIDKRVERLELDLSYLGASLYPPYSFPNPTKLMDAAKVGDSTPFSGLKSLRLIHLHVTDEVLHYILANCLCLEDLRVFSSDGVVNLKVVGPSLKLKYLDLSWCMFVKSLEISAPNLVSFMYNGPKEVVQLKHVPQLTSFWTAHEFCESLISNPHPHLSYLSQLTELKLQIPPKFAEEPTLFPLTFPTLVNLKDLELVIGEPGNCLISFTSLIKASPSLCRFAMKLMRCGESGRELQNHRYLPSKALLRRSKRWEEQRKATIHSHKCLNVVELSGFLGDAADFELSLHLLDIGVNLKRIVIDTREQSFSDDECDEESRPCEAAKEHARLLEMKLPPGAELVILSTPELKRS